MMKKQVNLNAKLIRLYDKLKLGNKWKFDGNPDSHRWEAKENGAEMLVKPEGITSYKKLQFKKGAKIEIGEGLVEYNNLELLNPH